MTRRTRILEFAEELERIALSDGGLQKDVPEGAKTVTLSATFAVLIAQELRRELENAPSHAFETVADAERYVRAMFPSAPDEWRAR